MWTVRVMLLEEHDLGATFGEQYQAHRQTTRMFGPVWLWAAILTVILLIVVSTRV